MFGVVVDVCGVDDAGTVGVGVVRGVGVRAVVAGSVVGDAGGFVVPDGGW